MSLNRARVKNIYKYLFSVVFKFYTTSINILRSLKFFVQFQFYSGKFPFLLPSCSMLSPKWSTFKRRITFVQNYFFCRRHTAFLFIHSCCYFSTRMEICIFWTLPKNVWTGVSTLSYIYRWDGKGWTMRERTLRWWYSHKEQTVDVAIFSSHESHI